MPFRQKPLCSSTGGPGRVRPRIAAVAATLAMFLVVSLPGASPWAQAASGTGAVASADASMDRHVLVTLYHATHGPGWAKARKWLEDTPIGEWEGVRTDDAGRVIGLVLPSNGLTGELPTELGLLSELQVLDLEDNYLSGDLPPGIGNLAGLRVLNLGDNLLSGPLPVEFAQLTELTDLNLHFNRLSGPVPAFLGSLSKLRVVDLRNNELSGTVPVELGRLSDLTHLTDYRDLSRRCLEDSETSHGWISASTDSRAAYPLNSDS